MSHHKLIKGFLIACILGGTAFIYVLWQQGLPLWVAYLIGIGAITFLSYGIDKLQARGERTRIPESVLHVFSLVGGTPGAFLGQSLFRHKTCKSSFRRVFWAIVILQLLAVGLVVYLQKH